MTAAALSPPQPRSASFRMVSRPARGRRRLTRALALTVAAGLLAGGLSGCNTLKRLSEVGDAPTMSEVENPTLDKNYQPVSMPMPTPQVAQPNPNSLWRPGARAFFKDQRASTIGDILTVVVAIQDESATLENSLTRGRSADETAGVDSLAGYETSFNRFLPEAVNPADLIDFGSTSDHAGTGSYGRSETINIRLAAVVLQVLPNGNLVIAGKQEVRVNRELRELTVTGVIRPQDVASDNTVNWDKIAEARITYGGRGTVSDMVEPRYGQQVYDILFPF